MAEGKRDKCTIPQQLKTTIGRLIVVIAAEAEPAKKIHFVSSLIGEIRSAMLIYVRYWKCETVDEKMWQLIKSMMQSRESISDYDKVHACYSELQATFYENEKLRIHYDKDGPTYHERTSLPDSEYETFCVLKDYYEVLKCRQNWKGANRVYFSNPNAWMQTNEMLADIYDELLDIANKRDLIVIPENTYFNISEMHNFGTFKPVSKGRDDNG